jgi:hypothetical protein
MIIEKQRIRRHIGAGVVYEARTSLSEHRRQRHPFGGDYRPWPHRDDDGIRLDDAAVYLDTFDRRSTCAPDDAGDSSSTEFGAVALRGAHDGGGERAGVNDRGSFPRCQAGRR